MKKVILFLFIVIGVIAYILNKYLPQVEIATGYAAKNTCSAIYHGRTMENIMEVDLAASMLNLVDVTHDKSTEAFTASIFGLKPKTAIYRKGLGCSLLQGDDDFHISRESATNKQLTTTSSQLPQSIDPKYNSTKLDKIKSLAMDTPGQWALQSTSLLIVHRDSLITEHYRDGFDSETEILGWSMTKSVCNLLVGLMSKDGLVSTDDIGLYPAWENDDRKNISLANLLKMNTGLSWQEEYTDISDITHGLFIEEDIVAYARSKPLENPIGTEWEYSSGTTNLISGFLRRRFESYQEYLDYPHKKLFAPLGITDANIETDESGNYVLSSFMYAKARDWAKLGLLYLHKGNWQGEQLIDSSYIDWSLIPTSADPNYGAHIWLNTNHKDYPSAPEAAYKFSGYNGQYVVIIPEHDLVIVRTGMSKGPPFDMDALVGAVIELVE